LNTPVMQKKLRPKAQSRHFLSYSMYICINNPGLTGQRECQTKYCTPHSPRLCTDFIFYRLCWIAWSLYFYLPVVDWEKIL
jgi:hypothetical protein